MRNTHRPVATRAGSCVAFLMAVSGAAVSYAQGMGAAPAWAQAMPSGTWASVSVNTIDDFDPAQEPSLNPLYPLAAPWSGNNGHSCVIECWNGGAFASRLGGKGSLIAWGGGHKGYYGNEVYAFDMATRQWSRLSNPYPTPSFPITDGIWANGSPAVPHTYAMVGYHPATNSFVSVQTEWSNLGGQVAPVPVFFDLATKTWRRAPRAPALVQYGGWAVYDASRDAWWMEGGDSGGQFAKYAMNGNGTAGTWTMYPPKFNALDALAERDPVNDIIVMTTFGTGTNMYGLDLKNPSSAPVLLRQGGSPPTRQGRHGWEWSVARQSFIYWRSGSDVYEVHLTGGDWRTGTWEWNRLTSSANALTPQDPSLGIYNRFRIASYDDAEIAVVVNSTTGPVYAFKLPSGSFLRPTAPVLTSIQ